MPGLHCAVFGCSNGHYWLEKWKSRNCDEHSVKHGLCSCPPPFKLYTFPLKDKQPEQYRDWIRAINRQDDKSGKPWIPKKNSRVCSVHFTGGQPSETCPVPCLLLGGYDTPPSSTKKRKPPASRQSQTTTKKTKSNSEEVTDRQEDTMSPGDILKAALIDHSDYFHHCDCSKVCTCKGCIEKDMKIHKLTEELAALKLSYKSKTTTINKGNKFIKSDKTVRQSTGLNTRATLEALYNFLKVKANRMRYWEGSKRIISTKVKQYTSTPTKCGAKRKLSIRDELVLVLMKLRLGVNHEFLASIFGITCGTCSKILNTWIVFLAKQLRNLVFWPSKETIKQAMPASLQAYANLRCIIDCAETFIERPRDLLNQAATWSDYKHHNTLKYLVCIAPNGHISYISEAWGGRTSDRHIVVNSDFLNLLDPHDVVMADRGFPIQQDLLFHQASLLIPPPSSGKTQMTAQNVIKTKKIANARIHVERAINRLKWFKIVSSTVPISMVHLFNDILIICAALCNLLPPLVV